MSSMVLCLRWLRFWSRLEKLELSHSSRGLMNWYLPDWRISVTVSERWDEGIKIPMIMPIIRGKRLFLMIDIGVIIA